MAVRTAPNGENKTQARQNASVDGRMGSEASTGNAVIGTGIEEDTERENGSTVVRVRYFAAARSAAGVAEEDVEIGRQASVQDVLAMLRDRHGERLATVLTVCSLLLNAVVVHDSGAAVPAGAELDVLPPFAGG
ncbi:MAG TPA: MoaD/ThiS family protein [Pseudonocardiaceae bacterium]